MQPLLLRSLVVVLLLLTAAPANAKTYTCAEIRMYKAVLPKALIDYYTSKATPAQLTAGAKCFAKTPNKR